MLESEEIIQDLMQHRQNASEKESNELIVGQFISSISLDQKSMRNSLLGFFLL